MKRIVYFYVLIDPRDLLIKYVGRTVSPTSRLSCHISESKNNKSFYKKVNWISKLLSLHLKPIMKIIYEENMTEEESKKYEKLLIKKISKKFELKNSPNNADGLYKTGTVVHQYNLFGEYIKTFENSNHASIETGITDANILSCCKNKRKSAGNFMWSFKKESVINFYNRKRKITKKVLQYDMNNNFIKEFVSAPEVERTLGIPYKLISACCNNSKNSAYGYKWKFK